MTAGPLPHLLVTDFDGTLTRRDFYQLFCERYLPQGIHESWDLYRSGGITHFEAMRRIFAGAAPGEAALLELLPHADLEPELPAALERLHGAGWEVVVVSAGCHWYIDRLLRGAGVDLVVHANPGEVIDGRLTMRRPLGSPFAAEAAGVDKPGVVRWGLAAGRSVAFAGDGLLDLEPALLVPPGLRFARGDLAAALTARAESFRPFERWREVALALAP